MGNLKFLIAAGCSFTQVPNTYNNWPFYLSQKLNLKAYYLGLGSGNNTVIARRAFHKIHECITKENIEPEELLVGIMWSGVNRNTFYLDVPPVDFDHLSVSEDCDYKGNPCRVSGDKNYYNVIPTSDSSFGKMYYKNFHSLRGALINTLEHMLRLQLFLKEKNIPYFFTEHSYDGVNGYKHKYNNTNDFLDPDVKHIDEMIDYSHFLPVNNMEQWNTYFSGLEYDIKNDNHPTSAMSEAFVDKIIIPFIQEKRIYG